MPPLSCWKTDWFTSTMTSMGTTQRWRRFSRRAIRIPGESSLPAAHAPALLQQPRQLPSRGDIGKAIVRFWAKDKRLRRRVGVQCSLEEFIEKWDDHAHSLRTAILT